MKIIVIIFILLAAISVGLGLYIHKANLWPIIQEFIYTPKSLLQLRGISKLQFEPLRPISDQLSPQEMFEDLQRIKKDILQVHPKTLDGLTKELEKAFDKAFGLVEKPLTVLEFHGIIAQILTTLGDAHTTSRLQTPSLPLDFIIIGEEFFIVRSSAYYVEQGDKLKSIGGVNIKDIYNFSKSTIAAENIYWFNYQFQQNALSLANLFNAGAAIHNGQVEVTIERNGHFVQIPMDFNQMPPGPREYEPFKYSINKELSYAHFILLSCEYSKEYKEFLNRLFQDIKDNNIENLILDLRGNVGGNVAVINRFLRYIDIQYYSTFNKITVRLSRQASDQRGYLGRTGIYHLPLSKIRNNPVKDLLFDGNIFVLIDNRTFSAATSFATILVDNGLATTIGEPTGGMPTCYGDALHFQLPNSRLLYAISHRKFERVDEGKRFARSLYPDHEVRYFIEDIFYDRDLHWEKVMYLIKGN